MTPHQQAEHIAALIRTLYQTNDGPRLLAKVMEDFPNPRRVWNETGLRGAGTPCGWGNAASENPRR